MPERCRKADPFGAGKRICLGNNFSLLETHIIAALLVSRFQLRLKPDHQPQIGMEGTIVTRNGMKVIIKVRQRAPRKISA